MQLELLTPLLWKHPFKSRLHLYYQKLGYIPTNNTLNFKELYPEMSKAHTCDCKLTIYLKKLKIV